MDWDEGAGEQQQFFALEDVAGRRLSSLLLARSQFRFSDGLFSFEQVQQ